MSEIIITNENFDEVVMKSDKKVLIDFWATWCGPCKMIAPVVSEIADEYNDSVLVGKVNVDDEMHLASRFGIEVIPTLVVMENGKIINKASGYMPKEKIEELLSL